MTPCGLGKDGTEVGGYMAQDVTLPLPVPKSFSHTLLRPGPQHPHCTPPNIHTLCQ